MDKRGKIGIACLIGLLILVGIFSYFVFAGTDNWTIDGNKVYVDDPYVYISAEPHTINENGWVYFNVTSKVYEGDVDIIWGFDTDYLKPKKAELYKLHNVTKSYTCLTEYFNYTSNHFWCYGNVTTYDNETNETEYELKLIYEHDFEWSNLAEKTAYWNVTENWKGISGVFNSVDYDYGGMNKWYYIKNFNIQKDKNYLVRGFIEIPRNGFSPMKLDEKYWFAIKPSSETLQEAISNEHLYALDPWVNSTGQDVGKDYLDIDLISYYKLDETSGAVIDSHGTNDGENFGATRGVEGVINNSFNFSSDESDYVNLTDMDEFVASNELTISVWVNMKSTGSAHILSHRSDDSTRAFQIDNTGSAIRFIVWNSSGTLKQVVTTYDLVLGEWYHIVGVWNGTNIMLYINGTMEDIEDQLGTIRDEATNITLGTSDQSPVFWDGLIDEVGIWNRSLNSTEVSDLYNSGAGITYTPSIPDTTKPTYSNNQTNTTESGASCLFSILYNDNTALHPNGQYIFSTNNTGVWTNESVNFTATPNWANFTTILNSTAGISIGYRWYADDNAGNWNNTPIYALITTDTIAPNTTKPTINPSAPIASNNLECNATLTDNTQTNLTAYWRWYKNNVTNLTGITTGISNNNNTIITTLLSGNTSQGEEWKCGVTPNDGIQNGTAINSSSVEIYWGITFDVRDSYSNASLNNVVISCNYTDFDQAPYTTNPYGPYAFPDGNWECTFTEIDIGYYNKTTIFTADNDTIILILMSQKKYLTIEEHTWLEWLYTCWNGGDCWNLLQNINTTTTQTWQRLTGTDWSVILEENITSYDLGPSSSIEINYTIKIPYKAGVPINESLPIRLYFWFTDVNKTMCYNQDKRGDKENRAEDPYCLPLVAETLGPNNGTKTFNVELRPDLSAGTYNITRSVEIDPLGVWTQYGREDIGQIEVLEGGDADIDVSNENNINFEADSSSESSSSSSSGGTTTKDVTNVYNTYITEESDEEEIDNEIIYLNNPGITGGVIGTGLFSGSFIFIITIFCITFIVFVVITSRTILKIKKK